MPRIHCPRVPGSCQLLALLLLAAAPARAADGELDPSFAAGGALIFDPSFAATRLAPGGLAVAPDGRLWAIGAATVGGDRDFSVCRLTADAGAHSSLDVGFDLGGGNQDDGEGVAVASDGSAFAVGTADGPAGDSTRQLAVLKLTPSLTLDPAFGGDGRVTLNFAEAVAGHALAPLADGRVVLVGAVDQATSQNFLVARLEADGDPDPTFDGNGVRSVFFDRGGADADWAEAVTVDRQGRAVVVGSADLAVGAEIAVARVLPSGALDPAFSGDGKLTLAFGLDPETPYDFGEDVAVDRFGRIVVAARVSVPGGTEVGLVRLLADGTPDASFGTGGYRHFSILAAADVGYDRIRIALLPPPSDGLLVAGGFDPAGADAGDLFVVALTPGGAFDESFDGDGKATIDVGVEDGVPSAVGGLALQAGRPVVFGGFLIPISGWDDTAFVLRLARGAIFGDDFDAGHFDLWSVRSGAL